MLSSSSKSNELGFMCKHSDKKLSMTRMISVVIVISTGKACRKSEITGKDLLRLYV